MTKKIMAICFAACFCNFANAQIEGAYLLSKDYKAFGFGGGLNFNFPVSDADYIGIDAAYFSFNKNEGQVQLVPLLLSYRYTLDRSGKGFYLEPIGGLAFGDSDFRSFEKGVTAGLCGGYLFSGNLAFNLGLRFQHIFAKDEPAFNLLSLRLSHPLSFRKRDE